MAMLNYQRVFLIFPLSHPFNPIQSLIKSPFSHVSWLATPDHPQLAATTAQCGFVQGAALWPWPTAEVALGVLASGGWYHENTDGLRHCFTNIIHHDISRSVRSANLRLLLNMAM